MSEATTGPAGALTGTVLSRRYRLEQKLGSGGMSTVYLARDETLERWVAAKVLHREISDEPDQIERFSRESRAVAQVSHPNVVAVIDAGEDSGRPYIVFEYIEGFFNPIRRHSTLGMLSPREFENKHSETVTTD